MAVVSSRGEVEAVQQDGQPLDWLRDVVRIVVRGVPQFHRSRGQGEGGVSAEEVGSRSGDAVRASMEVVSGRLSGRGHERVTLH